MITFQRLGELGQFGNQMFQYATLLAVALTKGYAFGVPHGNRSDNRYRHFSLPDVFPGLTALDSSGVVPQSVYREQELDYGRAAPDAYRFVPDVFDITDGTDLVGYFQSEKYFAAFRDRLLQEFRPRPDYVERTGNFLADLRARTRRPVAFLHVRRGDVLFHTTLIAPAPSYYARACALLPGCHFLVLSDDYPWCRENIRGESISYSPFRDKFDDFALMCLADHGILASSTFSWWGAWLGDRRRTIISPHHWFRPHITSPDLLCPGWVRVSAWHWPNVRTIADALHLAVKLHQAGDLGQAELLYRQVLDNDPNQVDALHLIGMIAHRIGTPRAAIDYHRQALSLKPDFAEAHFDLGVSLAIEQRLVEAEASFRQAVTLEPGYVEAHFNLGVTLSLQGKFAEAEASFRQTLALRPDWSAARTQLENLPVRPCSA